MFNGRIMDYIGDISQIGGLKRYFYNSGRAKGVEAIDVDNGTGLCFTVLADRGLDIGRLCYKNIPVSFISRTGIVSPRYFDARGTEWLRSFTAGFLTTCGLSHVGEPCTFEGTDYNLHGLYSSLPAELSIISAEWINDKYEMCVAGKIRQAKQQYENIVLTRKIKCDLGEDKILIEDLIENEGSKTEPLMILYHMNFGYPFINPDSEIVIPTKRVRGWDNFSQNRLEDHLKVAEPDSDAPNLVYLHDVYADESGSSAFMINNREVKPEIGMSVWYNKNVLHSLGQWSYFCKRDYLLALEPCNNQIMGIAHEQQNGTLQYIKPGEIVRTRFEIHLFNGWEQIAEEREKIINLKRGE